MPSIRKRVLNNPTEEEIELRRGPWTLEEDTLLIHYIASHGEGHWNMLAKFAGTQAELHFVDFFSLYIHTCLHNEMHIYTYMLNSILQD